MTTKSTTTTTASPVVAFRQITVAVSEAAVFSPEPVRLVPTAPRPSSRPLTGRQAVLELGLFVARIGMLCLAAHAEGKSHQKRARKRARALGELRRQAQAEDARRQRHLDRILGVGN